MNFLQLARRTKSESGLSGSGPSSVASQQADDVRICNWVNDAWLEIQTEPRPWKWMRAATTGTVNGTTNRYAASDLGITSRFGRFVEGDTDYSATAFDPANPGTVWPVQQLRYDVFRDRFLTGAATPGGPQYYALAPNGDVLFGPTPDKPYTLRLDYLKAPQVLTADTDVPEMPEQFHMVLVWRALLNYAGFDAASETYVRAMNNLAPLKAALDVAQREPMRIAFRPLAMGWR